MAIYLRKRESRLNKQKVLPPEDVAWLSKGMPYGDLVIDIIEVAGFPSLSKQQHRGFEYLHNYLFFPQQQQWLVELRAQAKGERWYLRFVDGIYSGVQSARLAVSYHLENILSIEDAVRDLVAGRDLSTMAPGAVVGVGSTKKLEFEYHAYILAYRRTLEYLARAIAGYFKSDCNSFRELPKILNRYHGAASQRIRSVYEKHRASFSFVVSDGAGHTSLRDLLCHYEFLSAGVYNLTSGGLRFCGGAEALGLNVASDQLSDVLAAKLSMLDAFLNEMLCEMTDGIREERAQLAS